MWLETKLQDKFIVHKVLEIIEWTVDLSLTALFYSKYSVDSH